MERARAFLGHPHTLTDTVVHGKKLGSALGFPTVNLSLPGSMVVPALGVYATRIWVDDRPYSAVTNVGRRPTVDDGEAGVTEVVRGMDLLGSAPRQMYLQELLGFAHPQYGHVPMLLAPDGRRLSKRDRDLDLGELRKRTTAEHILGKLAYSAGIIDQDVPLSAKELAGEFTWDKLKGDAIYLDKL